MKEPNTIWKCAECGIVFEALQPCEKGDECIPACCGRGMTCLTENHSDGAGEKHVPVAAAHGEHLKITVGAVAHPMTEAHYIMWIEVSSMTLSSTSICTMKQNGQRLQDLRPVDSRLVLMKTAI